MLHFFRKTKKDINTNEIKNFNNIIQIIEDFIYFEDFQKADMAINEVLAKENDSFKDYIETVEEKKKKQELKNFKEKLDKIHRLKEKLDKTKRKYEIEMSQKKRKQELKFTKQKIDEYNGKYNFNESLALLNTILEKYKDDVTIINYINNEKKQINKKIEKYKLQKEKEIKNDAFKQAQELIGDIKKENISEEKPQTNRNLFAELKNKFSYFSKMKQKKKDKKLLDEINLLLESQSDKNDLLIKSKLAQVHSGFSREISGEKLNGYEIYGKIIGADKISGDNLGFHKTKDNYTFYIGDATGHGIRAGFIISQMTKKFHEIAGKVNLEGIVMEINNSLKQELKSGNFITSIFFDIDTNKPNEVSFVGMGHEPMFVYRSSSGKVEKIIPGGLAAGIRIIKDTLNVKKKSIELQDGDIIICYTDGIVEAKSEENKMYGIERIGKKLEEVGRNKNFSLEEVYKFFLEDLRKFSGGKVNYNDDVTLLLLKRDKNKEIVNQEQRINELITKEGLDKKFGKKLKGKNLDEIREEISKAQKENALKNIIRSLEILYKTGELLKLKQDCVRYIKDGYIHKKINFFLKKALENETEFKISQKNKKIQDKYNILKELYKKGDYETVVIECSNIISKDGNL